MSRRPPAYQTEHFFVADIEVRGFILTFNVKTDDLKKGASLIDLKNSWVRDTLEYHGNLIDPGALKAAAKVAVVQLRPLIESYFEEKKK